MKTIIGRALLAVVLVLCLMIIGQGAIVKIGNLFQINPGRRPPEGDPIKVRFVAQLRRLQESEVVKIDFTYANVASAYRSEIAASVTLQVSRVQPRAEQIVTFPCAAHYRYHISSQSVVILGRTRVQATGTGEGAITLKADQRLHYDIDSSLSERSIREAIRGPGQVMYTMSFRGYLKEATDDGGEQPPQERKMRSMGAAEKRAAEERQRKVREEARRKAELEEADRRATLNLKYANRLIDRGHRAKAKERLEEIVRVYPGTNAALQAAVLLETLR